MYSTVLSGRECNSLIVPTKEELGWQLWSQLAQQKTSNAESH